MDNFNVAQTEEQRNEATDDEFDVVDAAQISNFPASNIKISESPLTGMQDQSKDKNIKGSDSIIPQIEVDTVTTLSGSSAEEGNGREEKKRKKLRKKKQTGSGGSEQDDDDKDELKDQIDKLKKENESINKENDKMCLFMKVKIIN